MQYGSRTRYGQVWGRSHTALLVGAVLSLGAALFLPAPVIVYAQEVTPLPAMSADAPLADPVVSAQARFVGATATTWTHQGAQHLLLEDDVLFELGTYGFHADRAVVRIEEEAAPGQTLRHLAVYLEGARPLHGNGPVSAQASRLLVTATTRGGVNLNADVLNDAAQAPADPLVAEAMGRIARHRASLRQATMQPFSPQPLFGPQVRELRSARRSEIAQQQLATQVQQLPRADEASAAAVRSVEGVASSEGEPLTAEGDSQVPPATPILPTRGAVYLTYDRAVGSADDNHLMLIGNVRVVYQDQEQRRNVALRAERAVMFVKPGEAQAAAGPASQLSAEGVEGIYLEDNVVVTDGDFTVRAPRMYFDLELNKAVLLEAVMYTYDVKRKVPLYLRADVVRQTSATSFEATDALLTTSEFAEPHFAIASDRVTIGRRPVETGGEPGEAIAGGGGIESFTASHVTMRWGDVPIFYWPYLAGENREVPLRRISGGYSSDEGPVIQTTWDLFALSGHPRPRGVDLLARIDYRGDHGPAFGLLGEYDRVGMFGDFNSYLLVNDHGEDDFADRPSIQQDGDTRGFFRWRHRQDLQHGWDLSLEASYVSDETFLEEFDREEAYNARDYETSAFLRKQQDDWAVSLLTKYDFNDFVPQLTTLQTPGYLVDKLPELGYYRVGTSLWDDRLTYFTENRVSRMRLVFGDDAPEDRGFGFDGSMLNFGMSPEMNFEEAADAAGLPGDWVNRFDTRHEINAPLEAGIFNITPYVVGRFTGYDQDFDEYSGEDDQIRLWGQVGARATTQFAAVYDGVNNRLFDVNRLRHVIEPSVDVFASAATLDSEDLPVYDQDVENLDEGAGIRFGLTNTFQTQRGGPGRWRSVDWIRLRTDVVLREDDENRFGDAESQIARFFHYRPEFSTGGDHFYTELLWLVSDTLGVMGELTHDLETDEITQWRVGLSLQHSARLASHMEYEEIDVLDLKLLTYGFNYQLTTKYRVGFHHRLDFSENRSRGMSVSLDRRLPRWRLSVVGSYDEIDDETTLGIVLIPEGFDLRSPVLPLDQLFQPF